MCSTKSLIFLKAKDFGINLLRTIVIKFRGLKDQKSIKVATIIVLYIFRYVNIDYHIEHIY